MKRKNGLRSCGRGVRPGPSDGVDLNRNFGFKWGYARQEGSSAQGCAEEYRGAAPFSEPETRAVRDVVQSHAVAALLLPPWEAGRAQDDTSATAHYFYLVGGGR